MSWASPLPWIFVVLLLVACSPEPEATPAVTPPPLPAPGPTPEAERYKTVEEMMAVLKCEGESTGGAAKEHDTLRDFVACHVEGHNIDIYLIAYGSDAWDHIRDAQFSSVSGPGWIVLTPTGPEAARYVHGMLGGELRL